MKRQFLRNSWILALAAVVATGCSDDAPLPDNGNPEEVVEGQYLVSVTAAGTGESTNTYFIPTVCIDDANAIIIPVETYIDVSNTYSHYIQNVFEGFLDLKYGQGSAYRSLWVTIGASGKAFRVEQDFE